jgi:type IV pilus assembly protein PilM
MPSLPKLSLNLSGGRRSGGALVGLDVQPGYVAAVQARANGSVVVEHAAGANLAPDTVRDGEVLDEHVLGETLRELFKDGQLGKRVRVGVANQRTVLRTLELPPLTDRKELAAAVRFQAEDQMPMPLSGAVLDFHPLATIETPAGPRQRVVVVAAQRDMVMRLLAAVHDAGLRPEAVDLSAFALIRSLYRREQSASQAPEAGTDGVPLERVLYLNVGGLTNMAIAEGTTCRFTRVVGGGLESMAGEIAERRGVPLAEAREQLSMIDLTAKAPAVTPVPAVVEIPVPGIPPASMDPTGQPVERQTDTEQAAGEEQPHVPENAIQQTLGGPPPDEADARTVLASGIREIAGEVRNSLDFHRSQEGGGEVQSVVLSGPALEITGFPEALEAQLGFAVKRRTVELAGSFSPGEISPDRLAVATGLAVEEVSS